MNEERRVLDNGLVVVAQPMEGKRRCAVYVGIDVGAKDEPPEMKGAAHLLEHMLFRSNKWLRSDEIAERAEFGGIDRYNATTSVTDTRLEFHCLPSAVEAALTLADQAIRNRTYDDEEFRTEKNGPVTRELVGLERTPFRRFAARVVVPRVFAGTPYQEGPMGTFETVRALEIADLLTLKKRYYAPNNMVVAAAGVVPDEFFGLVEGLFGKYDSKSVPRPKSRWQFREGREQVVYDDLKDPDATEKDQAFLYVGYPINGGWHADSAGLSLIHGMLAVGFTSYLFRELRKKRGIGYSPGGEYISFRHDAAAMGFFVPGLHPRQCEEAEKVIRNGVAMLKEGEFDDEFLEGKKVQFLTQISADLEGIAFNANRLISREFERPYYSPESLGQAVQHLCRGEIQNVAQRNFGLEPVVITAVPPTY